MAAMLLVIGNGATASAAMAIATAVRPPGEVLHVELATNDIATFDVGSLGMSPERATVFAAIGYSALNFARYDLWAKLKLAGYPFATLVHPAAICDRSSTLGENGMIGAGTVVDSGASIGRGTVVGPGSIVSSGTVIGAWNWLAAGTMIGNACSIGMHCVLGVGTRLADGTMIGSTSEMDSGDVLRGSYPEGTFLTPEFPTMGARLVRAPGTIPQLQDQSGKREPRV